jgi:hypothetical protein
MDYSFPFLYWHLPVIGRLRPSLLFWSEWEKVFWSYALSCFLSVAGFANFRLISYHCKVQSVVSDVQIPIFYAIAMGVDTLVALIIGKTYDKIGLVSLITIPVLTRPIPFFAFSHSYSLAVTSIVLWGAVMGIHETIMRAAIADRYGRNAGYPAPPIQSRTCGFSASGSSVVLASASAYPNAH